MDLICFSVILQDLNVCYKTILCFTFILLFLYMDITQLHACNNTPTACSIMRFLICLASGCFNEALTRISFSRPCFSQSTNFWSKTLQLGFTALDKFPNFFYKLLLKQSGKYILKRKIFQQLYCSAHNTLESSLKGSEGEVMQVEYSFFLLNSVKLLFILGLDHS